MVVSLQSLRITSDLDATGYEQGAAAIDAANRKIAASSAAAGAAVKVNETKITSSGNALSRLEGQYVAGARESQKFERSLRALNGALERDATQLERATAILAGMQAAFGRTVTEAELLERGMLGAAQAASRLSQGAAVSVVATERMAAASQRLAFANDNAALNTANLAAQFQDVGVTAAMGMSPLQIALQQGTQISAAFGGQGAAGALRSMGAALVSVFSPLSLVTIGLTAAAAAAIQWVSSASKTESLDEAFTRHSRTVDELRRLYGETAKAADNLASAGGAAFSRAMVSKDYAALQKQLTAQSQDTILKLRSGNEESGLFSSIANFVNPQTSVSSLKGLTGELKNFQSAADYLLETMRQGKPDLAGFNSQIEATFQTLAGSSENPMMLRDAADAVQIIGQSVAGVSGKFAAFSDPINRFMAQLSDGKPDVISFTSEVEKIGQQKGLEKLSADAIAFVKNLVDINDKLRELEAARFQATEAIRDRLASERMDTGQSFYQDRERQWELENRILDAQTQQTMALTDQQRIAAAGAMARAQNPVNGVEQRRQVDIAERQERERLDAAWAQSELQRSQGRMEAMQQSRQEIDLIGKTGAEVEALRFQWQAEADVRRAAAESGRTVSEAELAAIREQAAEIGRLAQQKAALIALDDLSFERDQIGRTREEQQVYSQIRQLGLDINSSDGRRVADSIRLNQQLEQQRDLVEQMSSTFASMFSQPIKDADDFIAKLAGGFASIGEANLQKAFNSILGGGFSSLGGSSGGASGASLINGVVNGIGKLFNSSNGAAERSSMFSGRQLREVSTSLGQVNKSAMQVAQQFAGLNEKADSPVLDSFMMSSGTWSRLSAKDTAWCAAFANAAIIQSGGQGTGSNLASSFMDWGMGTKNPQPGDIVVLKPQSAGSSGHVGFLASYGNGKVQIFGGNQSNGVNVQTYDASEVRAFRTDPNALRSAVSSGVVDANQQLLASGITRGVSPSSPSWQANTTFGEFLGAPGASANPAAGGAGGMGAMGNFGGMLSAGLGGFGMGYQSQNAAMGGLGGALSGFAAGGLPGAVIGGIAGIFGGIFGRKKQKKEELRKAQQELENQMGAIQDLMRTATGNFMGVFEKEYSTVTDELRKAISLADKAKNYDLKDQLEASMSTFFTQLTDRWNRGFEGMLQGMETGQGLNSAFVSGMDSVEKMRESLIGFVNDAKMFSEANGDLAGYYAKSRTPAEPPILNQYQDVWTGGLALAGLDVYEKNVLPEGYKNVADQMFNLGVQVWNEKGGALYSSLSELINAARDAGLEVDQLGMVTRKAVEPQQSYADSVERARQAAIKTALSTVEGASELTKFAEEIQTLQGKAASLPALLRDLGMSAEDASKAVGGSLNYAITKVRDSFVSDITGSMADLSGVGYINDIMSALSQYETRLSDATLLGFDTSLPVRELSLSIRDIARQSDLTKEELGLLSGAFPQLQFILNGVSTTSMTLSDATSQLDQAYREQSSTLDQLIESSKQGISAIKQFRDAMRINEKSPLSPYDKVLDAQKQFQDLAAKARSGDQDALGQLTQVSQSYLDAAQSYYASSTDYFQIWTQVDQTLLGVQSATEGQLSEAQRQKDALDAQVKGIIDVNDSVLSVKDALDQYNKVNSETLATLKSQLDLVKLSGANAVPAAFQQVNGRPGTEQELAYWQSQVANGRSIDQVKAAMGTNEGQLNALYNQTLGENLDAAGRVFWQNSGKTMDQIQADLEWEKRSQLSNLYRSIMGREIDGPGLDYWMGSGKSLATIAKDLEWAKANGAMRLGGIVGAFAGGGMVGNGTYNVDSVLARYAGGGNIALAGGEYVTRATSVNSRTAPVLDHINRTGTMPDQDTKALQSMVTDLQRRNEALEQHLLVALGALGVAAKEQISATKRVGDLTGEVAAELKRASAR
ncbi:TIGR02594 family protein [Rhizobium rhizoryzae]|uniref:TIGR02594 family protein n=1 Tax=Rhizobium rhizoryzae TaxID=451876 RepID=UPI0028966BC3|nr:TIGR02594 family protein [Rhizobium rhizoryzae]